MLQRLPSFSSLSLPNAAGGLSVCLMAAGIATPALAATSAEGESSALEQQQNDLAAFQVIAHRGASGHAPESTLAAFTLAHKQGADYLEMDAQLTADGKLVVFHDDTIERTSDGTGHINDYTLAELKALDVGTWFNQANPEKADDAFEGARLLTLDEVFEAFGHDARYYIETKSPELNPGLEDALLAKLKEYDMIQSGRVLVQSFNQPSLLKMHEQSPALPLVQLLWYYPDEQNTAQFKEWTDVTPGSGNVDDADFQTIADYAVGIGTNYIYEDEPVISTDFVHQAQDNDLRVHVYTVNDKAEMQQLLDWGVDGMFTNYPGQLIELAR